MSEWIAYAGIDPFGDDRADWRSAQLCLLFYNAWRDGKKTKALGIGEFMYNKPEIANGEADPQRQVTIFEHINSVIEKRKK